MKWEESLSTELNKCMSAVMSCGGPIALLAGDGTAPGAKLQIFSGAGELVCAWDWDFGRVRALGWTPNVELVCVLESARVMLWNLRGARVADFSLSEACEGQAVQQCEIFSDGFVVLTTAFRLFAMLSFDKTLRTVVPLADPRLSSPPTAMAVLEKGPAPAPTLAAVDGRVPPRCPEVLLATASRTILVIDERDAHDQLLASGPFVRLAPSPNGKFIAAFASSGKLLVLAADFSRNLSELATQSPRPPRQLVWCGADSLLLPWDRLLLMVGPYGDSVKYTYPSPPLLHSESDGVRILSKTSAELLQRVPEATEQVFLPGSLAPAARCASSGQEPHGTRLCTASLRARAGLARRPIDRRPARRLPRLLASPLASPLAAPLAACSLPARRPLPA